MPSTALDTGRITEILRRYGATRIVLFGGAVNSSDPPRDVDLAVDGIEGWAFFQAAAEVERELMMPVDLIPLSPPTRFTRHIELKGRVLYGH